MIEAKLDVEVQAFDVPMFCLAHNVSRALLQRSWAEGWGPRFFKAGPRLLISKEAAAKWRLEMEQRSYEKQGPVSLDGPVSVRGGF